jgi:hypothetical protein
VTPWRIDLVSFPAESFEKGTLVWHNSNVSSLISFLISEQKGEK